MKHLQTIQDFQHTFDAYEELDEADFYVEVGCWVEFFDEHSDDMTDDELELYWEVDNLIDVAKAYYEGIAAEEEADERRDEAQYLTSEFNH